MPAMSSRPVRGALLCALALLLLAAGALSGAPAARAATDPLAGNGMWIWNIPNTERGDAVAIGDRAKDANLKYVVVKAAHGSAAWSGFNAAWVSSVQAQGLKVCGYQRVLRTGGKTQARVLARQVKLTGADCAIIDAESELEGQYSLAKTYMKTLRAELGTGFPIALTSFPWIGYHPQFPYSVFLAPGAAQYNLPQIYWKDIGVSVAKAFQNTYPANSVYGRPIRPIGQLYQNPPANQIVQFRTMAAQYGSTGVSYWVWEQASTSGWNAIKRSITTPALGQAIVAPTLAPGARGDLVRWARMRLKVMGFPVAQNVDRFDTKLTAAIVAAQTKHGLPVTGTVTPELWKVLTPAYAGR
jgi:hypothetical protein